uniref:Uncharacterized protein n=1 Tax=Arion vulgaris TaxID=1028688 RepID=A0A0B7ALM2_9EUPU
MFQSSKVCRGCHTMEYTHNHQLLRVPPSGFVVKIYSSSLLLNHTDPQGSEDFISGLTP